MGQSLSPLQRALVVTNGVPHSALTRKTGQQLASLLKNSMIEPTVGMSRELSAVTILVMRSASRGPVSSLPATISSHAPLMRAHADGCGINLDGTSTSGQEHTGRRPGVWRGGGGGGGRGATLGRARPRTVSCRAARWVRYLGSSSLSGSWHRRVRSRCGWTSPKALLLRAISCSDCRMRFTCAHWARSLRICNDALPHQRDGVPPDEIAPAAGGQAAGGTCSMSLSP